MIPLASVHGRFQPFHNGHLAYVLAALDVAECVHIGLTRISSTLEQGMPAEGHRFTDEANPFSYDQRVLIIESALKGEGIDPDRFRIQAFPIEEPAKLLQLWSTDFPCLTTTVDEWNLQKISLLEENGYKVQVLKEGAWTGASMTSGTELRAMMRAGSDQWKTYVPTGAHVLIQQIIEDWPERIAVDATEVAFG